MRQLAHTYGLSALTEYMRATSTAQRLAVLERYQKFVK
jgi:hypothetical protein